jgi:sulfite exporter TauE/SafE
MSTWLAWAVLLLVGLVLGAVGYHFSLRALRVVTAFTAVAAAAYITWYGLTQPAAGRQAGRGRRPRPRRRV